MTIQNQCNLISFATLQIILVYNPYAFVALVAILQKGRFKINNKILYKKATTPNGGECYTGALYSEASSNVNEKIMISSIKL